MHRALGRASLARRFCVFGLRRAGGLAAEGSAAGLRVQHVSPAGVGDGGNGVSSDADGSGEVVYCGLLDGPRQTRRRGQVSAAGTRGGVPDGVDHGAQAAPRAERGPRPPAAAFSRRTRPSSAAAAIRPVAGAARPTPTRAWSSPPSRRCQHQRTTRESTGMR